ncbi:MAG: ester cyclase, partial [Hyphomonadaceae bacterium]
MNDPKNLNANYWQIIDATRDLSACATTLLNQLYAPDCVMSVCAPFDRAQGDALVGHAAIYEGLFAPLLASFSNLQRRTEILMQGQFKGGDWVASYGWLIGKFESDFFGITPTHRHHWLRFGWFERIEDGHVVESIVILDVPRLMIECGVWPVRPQLGENWSPAPVAQDGLQLKLSDPIASEKSLKLVEAMIAGLMSYDGKSLKSMGMTRFWTPQFHWYGPGGIGSARGHQD